MQIVGLHWSVVLNVDYDIFIFGPNDPLLYCVGWNVKIYRLLLSIVKKYVFNSCNLCCGVQSINWGKYRRLEVIRCLLWCGSVPSLIICREGMRSKRWSVLMLNLCCKSIKWFIFCFYCVELSILLCILWVLVNIINFPSYEECFSSFSPTFKLRKVL